MRKTKIICTLGPATDKEGVLRALVENGMNVARFNFSHGSHEEHKGRLDALKAMGLKVGLIRPITLWPFPVDALKRAASHAKHFLAVEMSMGQMVDDVRLAIECKVPVHFYGRTGGMIPTPAEVLTQIEALL